MKIWSRDLHGRIARSALCHRLRCREKQAIAREGGEHCVILHVIHTHTVHDGFADWGVSFFGFAQNACPVLAKFSLRDIMSGCMLSRHLVKIGHIQHARGEKRATTLYHSMDGNARSPSLPFCYSREVPRWCCRTLSVGGGGSLARRKSRAYDVALHSAPTMPGWCGVPL